MLVYKVDALVSSHSSPLISDWYCHPASLMKSGILGITSTLHKDKVGGGFELKHLMGSEVWLFT